MVGTKRGLANQLGMTAGTAERERITMRVRRVIKTRLI